MRVGAQGGEDLPGVGVVGKGQRGRAVGGDDPTADGEGVARCLPQGPVLVPGERGGREQQDQPADQDEHRDRKSTRLNSSHLVISYAVFCLKKKKITNICSSSTSTSS